jgi:hypothetical protein
MANLCLIYLSEVQKTLVPQHLSHGVQLEMAPVQYLKMAPVVQFLKRAPVVQFYRPVLPTHHRVYLKLAPVQFYQQVLYVNHMIYPIMAPVQFHQQLLYIKHRTFPKMAPVQFAALSVSISTGTNQKSHQHNYQTSVPHRVPNQLVYL